MKSRLFDLNLNDYIAEALKNRPDLRDSDSRLITHIWYREAAQKGLDVQKITAFDFLKYLRDETFTSTESIRRSRQRTQEMIPETRGKKYLERQAKAGEVKEFYRKENA
jgi:hypothetical protein